MKWIKILFIGCFVAFIGFTGLKTIAGKEAKSLTEGRSLTQFPDLDYSELTKDAYLSQVENAFSDQLSSRENKIRQYYDLAVNKLQMKYVGSVSIGKDNQLFEQPQVITDYAAFDREIKKIAKVVNEEAAKITKNGAKFIFINYPRKDVGAKQYLPSYYPDSSADYKRYVSLLQKELSDDVIFIDANELFQAYDGDGLLYYKTDHHVNANGTQLVYDKVMEYVLQQFPSTETKSLSDYRIKQKEVAGSYNRKIGYAVSAGKEELNLRPKWKLKYKRLKSKTTLFGKGNTYASAFMGGDYAYTDVTTPQKDAAKIMISGSSYTNALEAMIIPSCKEMISYDYRYNKNAGTLAQEVEQKSPDYLIYIPNQSDAHFSYETFRLHLGLSNKAVEE